MAKRRRRHGAFTTFFEWDDAADPEGNVQDIAEHGVTPEEVEAVFADCPSVASASRQLTTTRTPAVSITDAGAGFQAPVGLAFAPTGELYVTDEDDSVVKLVLGNVTAIVAGKPGEHGAANGEFARFDHPRGVTVGF